MNDEELQRRIRHELSGGWLMTGIGGLLVLYAILAPGDKSLWGMVGVLTAMLGGSVVRSARLLRALAERVLEADGP